MTSSARDSKSPFQKLSIGNTPGLPLAWFPTNSETDPLLFLHVSNSCFQQPPDLRPCAKGKMFWSPPGTDDLLDRRSECFLGRAKCELTAGQWETFLKAHIVDLSDKTYQDDDYEVIIQKYNGFLCAIAGSTTRVNATMVRAAAKQVYSADPKICKDFGDAMSGALSYCYSKGTKASSGKKLSDYVKAVILRFPRSSGVEKIQQTLASPGKGSPSSSAPSRPAATPPETGEERGEVAAPLSPTAAQAPTTVPGLPNQHT